MRPWAFAAVLMGAILIVPTGQAALNGDHAFAIELPFPVVDAGLGNVTILSGSLAAQMAPTTDPMLFFNMGASAITGLTHVCWTTPTPECRTSTTGDISVTWQSGSSVALKFPRGVTGSAAAAHGLVFFLDVRQTITFGNVVLHFGRMMGTGTVGGQFTFGDIPEIPFTAQVLDLNANNAAGLLALDDQTLLTVTGGGAAKTFAAAHDSLTFQGSPQIASFTAEGMVLPFSAGAISMGKADAAAAKQGLDLDRVAAMQNRVSSATGNGGSAFPVDNIKQVTQQLGGIQDSVLNGALLSVPTHGNSTVRDFTLIRFDALQAMGGQTVAASGTGPLHIQNGRVQNAPALVGFAYFQLPWWSYVLWILAIAAFVTRMVLGEKAPKKNERWDRLKWIGWVAGPLAFLLFFFLWDNEVRTVWGTSLLSGPSGAGLLALTVLELAPLGIVFFAVVTPLRILIRSGLRIGKQGTFMGLSGPTATLLGFLIGATLMLSYVDFALRQIGG